jgi:limonene-1,2-epoxide hydrolase
MRAASISKTIAAVCGALLCAFSVNSSAAQKKSPQTEVVEAFLAAVNRANQKEAVALLATDFKMPQRWSGCAEKLSARDCQIERLKKTFIDQRATLETTGLRNEREIVRVNLTVKSKALAKAGIERILVTQEFIVRDGKIESIIETPRTEDQQTARYAREGGYLAVR